MGRQEMEKKVEKENLEKGSKAAVRFTREELSEKVLVPQVVEQDLKRIISDRLEQCGLYFRVFSRIKTALSMERKFEAKDYGEERKLQDLVGVRVNLYFDDDVDLCQSIMERTFEVIEWSTSERNEDEFKPAKLNGVFRLPEYLKAKISPATWDMCIDDTFEVQIKTVFFEGWHEIEHDMRYKGEELWSGFSGFSRYFNSILATLELCDKSMVALFEDLGHDLYKNGRVADMIRAHFRLKLSDTVLYPEVEQVLREDMEQSSESIAKRIYKTSKGTLVDLLLKRVRRMPINVNTIIALLNDNEFHDPRLTEIFRNRDVYNDGREDTISENRPYQLRPLASHCVFRVRVHVDGSRIKDVEEADPFLIFEKSTAAMWRWLTSRYTELVQGIPASARSFEGEAPGYRISVQMDEKALQMNMHVQHLDMEVGGRIWNTKAVLAQDEDGKIMLEVDNGYAEPAAEYDMAETPGTFFSYPGFYKSIVDSVGVRSGVECCSRRRILREDQIDEVADAIRDPGRQFPLILIISKETPDGMMDEGWLDQFRVSDFTRTVWRYTHVFTSYEQTGREVLDRCALPQEEKAVPALYIFWPDGTRSVHGPEDVANCTFGRHLEARDDARTYDIVHGGQAFYHQTVADLRNYFVSD